MIKTSRQLGVARRQISAWNGVKRVVLKMQRDFQIEDGELISVIDHRIESINTKIDEYQTITCGSQSIKEVDDALKQFLHCPELLVEARVRLNWSQTELAEKTGIAPQQIQRYEQTGYRTIRLEKAIEIARVLLSALDDESVNQLESD